MKKICFIFAIALLLTVFSACGGDKAANYEDIPYYYSQASNINIGFVDKRFELVSLVFRLAGRPEHNDISTSYQRRLASTFDNYRQHPLVTYTAQNLHFGYDAVFAMAIHLEKIGNEFTLISDTDFLFAEMGGFVSWTRENAAEFIELLNDFYVYANFSEFFHENAAYFTEHSERFQNALYNYINFEWFRQHGFNPDNMRVVLSPSSSQNGYGGWIYGRTPDETIVYAALPGSRDYSGFRCFVIHEFAHAIGNPIAKVWYLENEDFRRWSDDSVDLIRMPFYSSGMIMAFEYVTRAYTILYMVENTDADLLQLLRAEYLNGFPYIQEVYAMITEHEKIEIWWW